MNKFQKMDAALSFAGVTILDETKVLIFICGLCLPEDRRYILQQKCSDLDEVCEAVIYLRQSKVPGGEHNLLPEVTEGGAAGNRMRDRRGD